MLTNLKRILRTQYIGAIISGYLGAQGAIALVSIAVYFFGMLVLNRPGSVIGARSTPIDWDRIIQEFIRALLYLALVAGLIRWLYVESTPTPAPEEIPGQEDAPLDDAP